MTIIYRKSRHPHIVNAAREAARGDSTTSNCPKCGNISKLVEKYKDRATYECTACQEISTFTINPEDAKKVRRTPSSPSGILVRDRSKEKTEIKFKKEEETKPEQITPTISNNLDTIRDGMQKKSNLLFEYVSKNGDKTLRDVEPYKLMKSKKGELLLYAYCTVGKGIRVFKLHSIKDIEVSETEFKPRWHLEDTIKR